jgi:hypothetical protein
MMFPIVLNEADVTAIDATQKSVTFTAEVVTGRKYAVGVVLLATDEGDDINITCNGELQVLDPGAANLANRVTTVYFENGVIWEANTTGVIDITVAVATPAEADLYGVIVREADPVSGVVEDQGTSLFCSEYACEYGGDTYILHSEMYTGATYLSKNFSPVGKVFDRIAGDYNERWHNGCVLQPTENGVLAVQVGHNQNEINVRYLPNGDLSQAGGVYTITGDEGIDSQFTYCFTQVLSDGRAALLVRGTPYATSNQRLTLFLVDGYETGNYTHTADHLFNDPDGRCYTRSFERFVDDDGNELLCILMQSGSSSAYREIRGMLFAPNQGDHGKWYNIRGAPADTQDALGTSVLPRFFSATVTRRTDTQTGIELLGAGAGQRYIHTHCAFWRVTQFPVGDTAPTADVSFMYIDADERLQYIAQTLQWCQYVGGVRTLNAAVAGYRRPNVIPILRSR